MFAVLRKHPGGNSCFEAPERLQADGDRRKDLGVQLHLLLPNETFVEMFGFDDLSWERVDSWIQSIANERGFGKCELTLVESKPMINIAKNCPFDARCMEVLTKMCKKSRTEEDEPWEWHVEASPLQQLEIKEELGRGGSGVVFLAKLKGLSYALKRARPSVENVNRVKKEIDIMRAMSHPHIMRPLRDGIYEGVPAYLMELGESMESFCTRSEWPETIFDSAFDWSFLGTFQGLDYILSRDCVHGDIKPSNMLITKWQRVADMCHMIVKLSDFGSAGKAGKDKFDTCAREFALPGVHSGTVMGPEHDSYSFAKSFQDILVQRERCSCSFQLPRISTLKQMDPALDPALLLRCFGHTNKYCELEISDFPDEWEVQLYALNPPGEWEMVGDDSELELGKAF